MREYQTVKFFNKSHKSKLNNLFNKWNISLPTATFWKYPAYVFVDAIAFSNRLRMRIATIPTYIAPYYLTATYPHTLPLKDPLTSLQIRTTRFAARPIANTALSSEATTVQYTHGGYWSTEVKCFRHWRTMEEMVFKLNNTTLTYIGGMLTNITIPIEKHLY